VDSRILGPLSVSREGGSLNLGGHRQKVLICLLLLHANQVVSTDRIIDVLWGEAAPATARKALQVQVSRLRQILGPGVLETRAPGYLIRVQGGELDVERFERLVAQGKHALANGDAGRAAALLRTALALWRGPALADVTNEPFAQAEAGQLEELRLSCLEERIEADLALGRHADLVGELEVLTDRHPYRERLSGRLMVALYRSGRQAEALDVYRRTRDRLIDDLGIEPGPELRSLASRVLNQDPRLGWTAPPASAEEKITPTGAFVGRKRELADPERGLDDIQRGRGSLFLISGEPGIGKTALAEQLAVRAAERHARVLSGRCWESGGAPAYWPCLGVLVRESDPGMLAAELGAGGADLAEIVPELREFRPEMPRPLSADAEGQRFRLFDAVSTLLREEARTKPIVLVLEDLHAADPTSLLLLRFVAAALGDARLLIMVTTRSGEPAAAESFASTLAELARAQRFHDIRLSGLSWEEVAQLVAATHDSAAPEALVDKIYTRTDGHPFFVREIVQLLARDNDLDVLPQGVRAVVSQRLALLPDECRELLAAASVVGREFGTDVLASANVTEPADVLDQLQEALSISLLVAVPGTPGRYRFAHELVREVVYGELPPTRAMTLHRQVGEALESMYAAELDPHAAELAHHFAMAAPAGTASEAIRYAKKAAERARDQLAYEEAVLFFTTALRAHELQPAADSETRSELLLALGDAQTRAGETRAAQQTFLRAAEIARREGWADMLARAALGYGGRFVWEPDHDRDQRLSRLLEEALDELAEDSPLRPCLLARFACAAGWYWGGPVDARRQLQEARSREAVELARRLGNPATLGWAHTARFVVMWGPDGLDDMLTLVDEIVRVAEQAEAWEDLANGLAFRYEIHLTRGEVRQAQRDLEGHTHLVAELKLPSHIWHAAAHYVELMLLMGRFTEAAAGIDQALHHGMTAHPAEAMHTAVFQRFVLFLQREGALEELRQPLERWEADRPDDKIYSCLLARLDCEQGHRRQAEARLDLLDREGFAAVPRHHQWLLGIGLLAEVAATVGNSEQIETLYELLHPYAANVAGGEHIRIGSVSRYLGILAGALSRLDEAAWLLHQAVEANERIGALPWSAHSKEDLAQVLLARDAPGDREEADDLLREALATYHALGMTVAADKITAEVR
jgi:DNA-binding SARP family transcriptional activator/tetratricopeptide (TPR) repeat protein